MQPPLIEISDQPNPDAERILGNGLAAFNEQATGYHDRRPLSVLVKDPHTQQVLGGITGRSAFEDEARRRGCRNAVLYTISFQAPGFYEKNGWVRFGEIACEPEGNSRVFLSKQL